MKKATKLETQIQAKQAELTRARKAGEEYGGPVMNRLMAEMEALCALFRAGMA